MISDEVAAKLKEKASAVATPRKQSFISQGLGASVANEGEEPKASFLSAGYAPEKRAEPSKELQERLAAARRNDWWANGGANILADARAEQQAAEQQHQFDTQQAQNNQQYVDTQKFTAGQNEENRDFQAQQAELKRLQDKRTAELQRTQQLTDAQKQRLAAANANQNVLLELANKPELDDKQSYNAVLAISQERGIPVIDLIPAIIDFNDTDYLQKELKNIVAKDPQNVQARTIIGNIQRGGSVIDQIPNIITLIAMQALGLKADELSQPANQIRIAELFKEVIDTDLVKTEANNTLNKVLIEDYRTNL